MRNNGKTSSGKLLFTSLKLNQSYRAYIQTKSYAVKRVIMRHIVFMTLL